MFKLVLCSLLCLSCAVEVSNPQDAEVAEDRSYEPVGGGESPSRFSCVPDMTYDIGGDLVVVPGYCHPGVKDIRPIDPENELQDPKDMFEDPASATGLR